MLEQYFSDVALATSIAVTAVGVGFIIGAFLCQIHITAEFLQAEGEETGQVERSSVMRDRLFLIGIPLVILAAPGISTLLGGT